MDKALRHFGFLLLNREWGFSLIKKSYSGYLWYYDVKSSRLFLG